MEEQAVSLQPMGTMCSRSPCAAWKNPQCSSGCSLEEQEHCSTHTIERHPYWRKSGELSLIGPCAGASLLVCF